MDSLIEILQSMEFENDGWLRITSLMTSEHNSTLNISVHTGQEEEAIQLWHVIGTNTEGYHIEMETCYDIEILIVVLLYQLGRKKYVYTGMEKPECLTQKV